jgi:hypothetical protein
MLGPSLRKRPFIVQRRNLRNSIVQRHEPRCFSQIGNAAKPNRSVTKWQDLALFIEKVRQNLAIKDGIS